MLYKSLNLLQHSALKIRWQMKTSNQAAFASHPRIAGAGPTYCKREKKKKNTYLEKYLFEKNALGLLIIF